PGLSAPRFTASWMMKSAARSFTDWPGFMNSALPRMVQPVSSEARLSLMRGVRPTAAATPLANGKADLLRAFQTRLRKRQRKERGEAPQGNAPYGAAYPDLTQSLSCRPWLEAGVHSRS